MSRDDLRALRKPLLLVIVLLALTAAGYPLMQQRLNDAHRRLQQAQTAMRDAQLRVQLSGQEREVITRHLERYRRLEQAGFIAPEQRINWVSGLRTANQAADLFGIEYQIDAQRPYHGSQRLDAPQLAVLESPMRLKAALLHEEDLMRLIDALAEQRLGLFVLGQCTVKRIPGRGRLHYQPQLEAECELSWLTAHPKDTQVRR
jgi:hypothetical protein